jgi:hypothetical protein
MRIVDGGYIQNYCFENLKYYILILDMNIYTNICFHQLLTLC